MTQKNSLFALLFHTLFIIFIVAPLVVVVLVSFTDKGYIAMPFSGASLRWFSAIWDSRDVIQALITSVGLAFSSACVAIVLAVPAALAFSRYQFPGKTALMGFFMSPLMIPQVVLGVAFLRFFSLSGIGGSFIWLVLTHVVVVMPYALRLVLSAAIGTNREIEHAARSLGASRIITFIKISIPMLIPGIVGGWLLSFIQSFDELTMTIFVATPSTMTLPVVMYNHIAQTIDPLVASVSTVLIVGTLVIMLLLEKLVGLDKVLIGKK